jgi:hypothetical protein
MHTVVEMPRYQVDAARLFAEDEQAAIIDLVAADPRCGVVVPGGGSIRKVRVGFGGRGKRGGARVIYLFGGDDVPVFLLAAFAKNEKDDLTPAERSAMAKAVATMLANYRRQK